MTVLARTKTHLVEYSRRHQLLTIARSDGKCISLTSKRIAGDFRDCLKTHSAQEIIDCFIRIAGPEPKWGPLYKERAMPSLLDHS